MVSMEKTVLHCIEEIGSTGRFQLCMAIMCFISSLFSGYLTFNFQSLTVSPEVSVSLHILILLYLQDFKMTFYLLLFVCSPAKSLSLKTKCCVRNLKIHENYYDRLS